MVEKIMVRKILVAVLFCLIGYAVAAAQANSVPLTVAEILHRADSVSSAQDSIFSKVKYQYREEDIFNELDGDGNVKKTDTTIAMVTMLGREELSREMIYPKNKSQKKDGGKKGEVGFSLSPDNPDQTFTLLQATDSVYIISVTPKAIPPKEGAVKGTMQVDKYTFITKKLDFEVPKPEGALKEFSSQITFQPLGWGPTVMAEMNMKGFARAMLGIIKIRFTGTVHCTDYQIVQ
jgi:hypothetical protein